MTFDASTRGRRLLDRRFLIEWAAVGCLGLAVIVLGVLGHLTGGVDRLLYDRLLMLRSLPLAPNVAVIDIDNRSIAELGRWPWPRNVHAELLQVLAQAKPAAVVYDVLLTESTPEDGALAQAMRSTPVFLPVLLSPLADDGTRTVDLPVSDLAANAADFGHINLEVDPDGIVRSVALYETDGKRNWPQLMVPVWQAIGTGKLGPGAAAAAASGPVPSKFLERSLDGTRYYVPFSRSSPDYPHYSFVDVLAGRVPFAQLHNKILIVGASASGLYDRFATPISGEFGPLPGVYIHAAVLDMLMTGRAISPVPSTVLMIASLLPLLVLLGGFLMLSPWRSLLLMLSLSVVTLGWSATLLYAGQTWLSPAPAILGLLVVYPIWNWRRLEMTMSYLRRELERLAAEPHLLPETPAVRGEFGGDVLERQMALMARAAQRVQDMKRFVWDSLDSMPEPMLVTDLSGKVLIANHAARQYCVRLNLPSPEGRALRHALGAFSFVKTVDGNAEQDNALRQRWPEALDPTLGDALGVLGRGIEVRDAAGLDHLLRYAPCTNAQGLVTGWIAGLVDVTALHAAERQREEVLHLLSHDMRSPQASILALIDIERRKPDTGAVGEVLSRIQRYAQRSLTLADEFVQLARAESRTYQLESVNFADLLLDASDEVWPQAQAKRIRIELQPGTLPCWVDADRSLLTRALINLLNNAVKYSPSDTVITCTLTVDPELRRVSCTIRDQGYGISPEHQRHLFERFKRFHTSERPEVGGAGLGMAFVKTVVTRHSGEIDVYSAVGVGTSITIVLPLIDEPV